MDYLLARWYTVKNLSPQRLKTLHNFETAVLKYSRNKSAELKKQKIFLPLWWQEGAVFLNAEFKTFWLNDAKDPQKIKAFKLETEEIFKRRRINISGGKVFNDIKFMHRCDLAVNASVLNAGPASAKPSSSRPAQTAVHQAV